MKNGVGVPYNIGGGDRSNLWRNRRAQVPQIHLRLVLAVKLPFNLQTPCPSSGNQCALKNHSGQLASRDGTFNGEFDPAAVLPFAFRRKRPSLDDFAFDQFWLPPESLYGQGKPRTINPTPVVKFSPVYCGAAATHYRIGIPESYLLQQILHLPTAIPSELSYQDHTKASALAIKMSLTAVGSICHDNGGRLPVLRTS